MIVPVIISGGSGSRLWPLSRQARPKQFLPLDQKKSLFEGTLERVLAKDIFRDPIIIANEKHRFLALESCQNILDEIPVILLEPIGRNTMAAALLAALECQPSDVMMILPSDHIVQDLKAFQRATFTALPAARAGSIVTFGMIPDGAETGYGYIQKGDKTLYEGVFSAQKFVEKPDKASATGYLESGDYFWNAGIFLTRVDVFLKMAQEFAPDILSATEKAFKTKHADLAYYKFSEQAFQAIRSDSIDYAVMEPARNVAVVPVFMGWSDVGSFGMLAKQTKPDPQGNRLVGAAGDFILKDCQNTYIHGSGRLIAGLGLKDISIISTDDVLLVADSKRDQDVKAIVETLKAEKREELDFHSTVFRPWGTFKSIAMGAGFQVKRIEVYPGKRLSLQKHYHRAEHWVVVSGTATVTCNDDRFLLSENQSTYIPLGAVHRLENPGKQTLVVIEIQSGSYLGEDDIVRLDDDFKRHSND